MVKHTRPSCALWYYKQKEAGDKPRYSVDCAEGLYHYLMYIL